MPTELIKAQSVQAKSGNPLSFLLSRTPGLTGFSFLVLSLVLIYFSERQLFNIIASALSDAYLGVSVFVAFTLVGFYVIEHKLKRRHIQGLASKPWMQVPIASLLGALPGCGGAIIVVTRYVEGKLSFGALVAVLIATMGDAAFLLLAKMPSQALIIYGISMLAGTVFGYLVDLVHRQPRHQPSRQHKTKNGAMGKLPNKQVWLFMLMLAPGVVLGCLELAQVDSNALFGALASYQPSYWLGFTGALLCLSLWMSQPVNSWSARFQHQHDADLAERVTAETAFITVCVAVAFLGFELFAYFSELELKAQFSSAGAWGVLFAICVGLIPGCGPQILMTSLYINGVIPMSALLANAISNDGDALFPALALAPKDAFKATVYSAIPAFVLGYGCYYYELWL